MIKAIIRFFKKLFGIIETVKYKPKKYTKIGDRFEHGHRMMMSKRRLNNRIHNQMAIQSKRFNRTK